MKELDALQQENERLKKLIQLDALTNVLNRKAVEQSINTLLKKQENGVLLMMDVNEFKYINDTFGHVTGDDTLMELARILKVYFFTKDIIGRVGGDEFVVFMPGVYTKEIVANKVKGLNSRLKQSGYSIGIGNHLQVSTGAEFAQAQDDFQRLYERADIAMRAGKQVRTPALHFYSRDLKLSMQRLNREEEWESSQIDIQNISHKMKEINITKGAFYPDFTTFLSIYRYLERMLSRTEMSVHLILISLTDEQGSFIPLELREQGMRVLQESISVSLRLSDIYTQYSSCQFLVMVLNAKEEHIHLITTRIQEAYQSRMEGHGHTVLSYHFYPLEPAIITKS